jgi:hypothetical protein
VKTTKVDCVTALNQKPFFICSVKFCCLENGDEIASGDIYDSEYQGGRFGVYVLSQHIVTFEDVNYTCPARSERAFCGTNIE